MSKVVKFCSDFSESDFTSNQQIKFFEYWKALKGDRSMPSRADINPGDVVSVLPYIILVELSDGQYTVRLMGTICAEIFGEHTGKELGTIPAAVDAATRYDWLVENKKPYFNIKSLEYLNKDHVEASTIAMPLSSNDNDVDMIVLVHHFY
ncbi:PAS domain-containing protein [Pseudemcibacter aquimaris]|uniref:PAS domain-containing protein n=1 Tax=Pseudemcibacter aquimaris TaxID=2857064 RepID=UPI0020131576|nr:PAS domain-containing protein [Pseudemcibacter aquimaris]MCC3862436.1 PAS domain-containing protein [Pseudemcibacter aquimaris]WDU59135.1 PAS domain-containing protein [Pseudemcibacter aquimaris]